MTPKVSLLMSFHNEAKYLHASIESLLNQTCKDFELLVMDDGSTDKSEKIVCSFKDDRIHLYHQEQAGLTRSLNRLIQKAKGEWIARADADDVYLPQRLERQLEYASQNPEVGVIGSFYQNIDENSHHLESSSIPITDHEIRHQLLFYPPLAHPVVMFRKSLVEDVGGYNTEYRYAQDYDLWTRLEAKTRFANIPEILLYRRVHQGAISVDRRKEQIAAHFQIRKKFWETRPQETGSTKDWEKELESTVNRELKACEVVDRPESVIREELKQRRIAIINLAFNFKRPDIGMRNLFEITRLKPDPIWRSIYISTRVIGFMRTWKAVRRLAKKKFEHSEKANPLFGG